MTEISDELRSKLIKAFGLDGDNLPKPITNAGSQVSALSGKGGGRALGGGGKRARTAQQGEEETCAPMGKGKAAEPKPRQLVGREATTSNKGTRFRVYRVNPLLAVVVDGEE